MKLMSQRRYLVFRQPFSKNEEPLSYLLFSRKNLPRRRRVSQDLRLERFKPFEFLLGTDKFDKLHLEIFAVDLTFETEEMHLEESLHLSPFDRGTVAEIGDTVPRVTQTGRPHRIDSGGRELLAVNREIRGGESDGAPELATFDDGSDDSVDPSQKGRRHFKIPRRDCFTDTGAAHPHAVDLDRPDTGDAESEIFPERFEQSDVAGSTFPKLPPLPHADARDALGRRGGDERLHKLSSSLLGEFTGKRDDENVPYSVVALKEVQLVSRGSEESRGIARRKQLDGMRVKAHDHDRPSRLSG